MKNNKAEMSRRPTRLLPANTSRMCCNGLHFNNSRMVACMIFLLILFAASGCAASSTAQQKSEDLVWNEEAMFGLKQPDGVLKEYTQEFSGYSYVLEDMTDEEVADTIQAIKDLGFTDNPKVTDISYLGYHKENPYASLYIIHYKNQFMDEVTISSFIGSLADGNQN